MNFKTFVFMILTLLYCDYYIDDRNIGTPLTDKGYVDWNKMLVLLKQKNLL